MLAAQRGCPEARRRKLTFFPFATPIIVPIATQTHSVLSSFPDRTLKSWLRESSWILMTILTVRALESLSPPPYSWDL